MRPVAVDVTAEDPCCHSTKRIGVVMYANTSLTGRSTSIVAAVTAQMNYRTRPIAAAVPSASTPKPLEVRPRRRPQHRAERDHPSSGNLYPVSDDLDRLGGDEVQAGSRPVRDRR